MYQELWQQELEARRAALSVQQGITEAIQIEVIPTVDLVVAEDGGADMNLSVNFTYGIREEDRGRGVRFNVENRTDDFPLGAYNPTQSNACRLMLEFAKNKIETELLKYLTPQARVTIVITGETDGTPIRNRMPYNGEFGDFNNRLIFLNNELHNMTVTQETGITSNAQLAFLRAQGVENFIRTFVTPLHQTRNTFQIHAVENRQLGDEYRRISIEFIIHGAFNDVMEDQEEIAENFVSDIQMNIPTRNRVNNDLFVLIIANENYSPEHMVSEVPFAINDGKIFAEYCQKTLGIPARHIIHIEDGTMNRIQDGIDRITALLRSEGGNASAIVYYAGHGIPNAETNEAFIIPVDANPTRTTQLISLPSIYRQLGAAPAKSVLVVIDACFSGTRRNGEMILAGTRSVRIRPREEQIAGNLIIMAATDGFQTAQPMREQQHGLFTYYLLKTLQESNGNITLGDWFDRTRRTVARESILRLAEQTPTFTVSPAMENTWRNIRF